MNRICILISLSTFCCLLGQMSCRYVNQGQGNPKQKPIFSTKLLSTTPWPNLRQFWLHWGFYNEHYKQRMQFPGLLHSSNHLFPKFLTCFSQEWVDLSRNVPGKVSIQLHCWRVFTCRMIQFVSYATTNDKQVMELAGQPRKRWAVAVQALKKDKQIKTSTLWQDVSQSCFTTNTSTDLQEFLSQQKKKKKNF